MSERTNNKIKYLVADTTAFINAVPLNDYADWVLTVPDVVAEVRNKRQIRRLCVLPFDLQIREPRLESVKYCVEFAKKTGDYASLSGIDLKVIALTYELEADNVGTAHLRKEPVVSEIIASKDKPDVFEDNTKLAGWYNPTAQNTGENWSVDEEETEEDNTQNYTNSNSDEEIDDIKNNIENQLNDKETEQDREISNQQIIKLFEQLKCETAADNELDNFLTPVDERKEYGQNELEEPIENTTENEVEVLEDEGWITPVNIKSVKKSLSGHTEENVVPIVACMTTDYALQNVLKQMNLQISALDGRVIKHLRTYILRCYACFKTTSIMTKVFCPKCGNKTLKRVAVSLDENGKQVIHINTRRPLSHKYKNQSLPRFQGGKHSRNPILFEDQPIPRQMPSRVAKTKTNALDEDYVSGFSPFVMRDLDSKSAMLRSKGNLKEWARNNTFEEDRRRKHYNRLYK